MPELADNVETFGGTATSLYVEIPFEDDLGVAPARAPVRPLTAAARHR